MDDLVDQGARLLRDAASLPSKGYHRTPIYRDLAAVVTQLRERFVDKDGRPDWAGRTFPYRQAVGRLYAESGVPEDVSRQAQSALRYHFGNLVRQAATTEDLADLGLQERPPAARVKDTRDLAAARARAGAALVEKSSSRRTTATRAIIAADVMLAHVGEERLTEVEDADVADVCAALESLQARSSALLKALGPRRKRRARRT